MKGDTIYPLWGKYETKGIASPTALPGTRSSSATWKDASGNLWLFGGEGSAASGIKGALNDLWKYNPVTNQWTWVKGDSSLNVAGVYGTKGVSNAANNPGGRHNAASWVDNSGKFWLFGGLNSSYVSHNDLWKYDPVTNEWTWVKGSNVTGSMGSYGTMGVSSATNEPSSRQAAAIWKEADGSLWMFGGSTGISSNAYDDLWKFDPLTEQWTWISGNIGSKAGVYGSLGVMAAGNKPGGRQGAVTWTDNSGNIWMMGGYGYGRVTTPFGVLNDLWKLDVVTRQWTWVKGDSIANAFAEYGSLNVSSATNKPGGRYGAVAWKDASGRLLLCNGYGNSEWKMGQHLGDVWRYDIGANHWTWIKGDSIGRRGGIYGDTGVFAAPNYPGGRSFAVAWPAANGNCWIYGGNGSTSDQHGKLNDTWQYNAATNQFAWYHGITRKMHDGVYGTKGVAGALNNPGGRSVAMTWTDSQGDLWMFGGLGNFNNHLWWCINDLWKFSRVTQEWTWVGGDNTANSPGTYGTQGVASVNNIPPARTGGVTWKDAAGNFWLFGGVS
ncbi:MAG: Kelch repeat type 2-containing protein, partial [Chitinophagaceae bacterium]|nr:Kelch repeat type 2-containing protein [Chitinophagaceae bacterium]